MLNFALKGTYQDATGFGWDYYGDDQLDPNPDPNTFYIIPRPQFVRDAQGNPSFQVLRYTTDDKASNGSGHARFDVELSVPAEVEAAVSRAILENRTKFPNVTAPHFATLQFNPGGKARFDFPDVSFDASVSSYGSNVASFLLQLTKEQMDTFVAAFSGGASAFDVEYRVTVPARFRGISAVLTFDSSIAYSYQVTQPSYDSWGHETSPRQVQTFLKESAAGHTTITDGSAHLPDDVKQRVADWANDTLSDLVSAEVQKIIQIRGLSSDDSFNINEVSSFTNTYAENMVIDWILSPRASLPSFPAMGLDAGKFVLPPLDERKQLMTVAAHVQFDGDVAVDNVAVTVTYPTLSGANATHVFKTNDSHTFEAPFSGPDWSLDYTITYADPNVPPLRGSAAVTGGTYTLEVFSVVFDAQQAFADQQGAPIPDRVEVVVQYADSGAVENPVTLTKDNPIEKLVPSIPATAGTHYNYQVTYFYPGVVYPAPQVTGVNGFKQVIPAAGAIHPVSVTIYLPQVDANTNPILDATVQMWYQQPPALPPGAPRQPTKQSPAVFNLTPAADSKGNLIAHDMFEGVLNGDQPLVYTASIDTANGPIDIEETLIDNTRPNIMVSPTSRYYTVEIRPASLDPNAYSSVETFITCKAGVNKPVAAPSRAWLKGESQSQYVTWPVQDADSDKVSYDWKVAYTVAGQAVQFATGTGTDPVFHIPPHP
jgi:hypothetical protein